MTTEPPTNVPHDRGLFVGRDADLARLDELTARGVALVTVTGPAGAGKTRLARRFGARVRARYAGGVWFCDLSTARTAADVVIAVARVLELPLTLGTSSDEVAAQLRRALAARGPTLLILDNFEHLVAHAPETVGAWLDAAPSSRLLA